MVFMIIKLQKMQFLGEKFREEQFRICWYELGSNSKLHMIFEKCFMMFSSSKTLGKVLRGD